MSEATWKETAAAEVDRVREAVIDLRASFEGALPLPPSEHRRIAASSRQFARLAEKLDQLAASLRSNGHQPTE